MISRDRYETIESNMADRNLFSHLALGCLTFGLGLGVERAIQYSQERDQTSFAILLFCGLTIVVGAIFGVIAWKRQKKVNAARQAMFDSARVVSDVQTLIAADGTQIQQQMLTAGDTARALPAPKNSPIKG